MIINRKFGGHIGKNLRQCGKKKDIEEIVKYVKRNILCIDCHTRNQQVLCEEPIYIPAKMQRPSLILAYALINKI